jgi:protein-tyrosine phosphatase
VASDEEAVQLVEDLEHRLFKGEKIFIHCWGGHGRIGTIMAILLVWKNPNLTR